MLLFPLKIIQSLCLNLAFKPETVIMHQHLSWYNVLDWDKKKNLIIKKKIIVMPRLLYTELIHSLKNFFVFTKIILTCIISLSHKYFSRKLLF